MISSWIEVKKKIDNIKPIVLAITLFMIFFFISYVFYNPSYREKPDVDISAYLNNPLRVINGELPYRDFWSPFPPGEIFLPAFIYKVFGININILLIFSLVISALVGLFSFLLGKLIFRDNFFAVISALLVFFTGSPHRYLGYGYIHMYFLLLLISAFFLLRYLKNNALGELFLTGISIGLAFLFRVYEVGAVFLSIFLVILFHSKNNKRPLSHSIKAIAFFCGGALIVLIIVSLTLLRIWHTMVRTILIKSVLDATAAHTPYFGSAMFYLRLIFRDIKMINGSRSIFYIVKILIILGSHLARFISLMFLYILPFLLLGISILYLANKKTNKNNKTIVLFFLLWGILTLPKLLLGRGDISQLSKVITPLFFLLVFLLQKIIKKINKNKYFLTKFALYGFVFILPLLSVPFFLISKIYELAKKPYYEISTQRGRIFLMNESGAQDANYIISFINKNTKEGDYIFVLAEAIPYYVLTNRRNATYYGFLNDIVYIRFDEKQKEICTALLSKDTRLIIYYPYAPDYSNGIVKNKYPILLQRCIEDNFVLVEKYRDYQIYMPKAKIPDTFTASLKVKNKADRE